jgi:hypothetical protein
VSGFLVENNDAGGTNGTTISHANSGGASGQAWDTVTIGAGSTLTYDNAKAHGAGQTLSSKFVVPAGITTYHFWNLTSLTGGSGSTTQLNTRQYINLGTSGIKMQIHKCLATVSNTFVGGIYIDATGHILIEDSAFSIKQTSTTVISTGQWYRLEYQWIFNATTGSIEVKIFTNPDSLTPAETLTATGLNTSTAFNSCHFGQVNAGASSATINMTGFGASNQGAYIGPKAYSAAVPGVAAAIAVAGGVGVAKAGTGAHVPGHAAAITLAGGVGQVKEGAKVHGVAAQIIVAGGTGIPNAARVPGHAAAITVAGTAGHIKSGAHVPGHAAALTISGTPGVATTGAAAIVPGHAAAITLAGGVGHVTAGRSARVPGHAAAITLAGGVGSAHVGDHIHGLAAAVTVAGGVGSVRVGSRIHGVGALFTVSGTPGVLDVPNVAATVPGVAAQILVAGTAGHVHAVSRVFGRAAQFTVAGGLGSPRLTEGNPNPTVILDTVKKALGFFPEYAAFDIEIMIQINAAIGQLRNMGIGPDSSFRVTDRTALWSTFWPHPNTLGMIQTFIFLYVRLNFDMPGTSFNIGNLESQLAEWESRLIVMAETITPPSDPFAA